MKAYFSLRLFSMNLISTHRRSTCIYYCQYGLPVWKAREKYLHALRAFFHPSPNTFFLFSPLVFMRILAKVCNKTLNCIIFISLNAKTLFVQKLLFPPLCPVKKNSCNTMHMYKIVGMKNIWKKKNQNLQDRCNEGFAVKAININILVLIYFTSCI